MTRVVRGIAINDTEICGPACTTRDEYGRKQNYPDYALWYGMLVRCTCEKTKQRNPTYKCVTCHPEWLLRSNFKLWYNEQPCYLSMDGTRLDLDKDILVRGNTEYGPDRCCLVPRYLNTILGSGLHSSSGMPMWVTLQPEVNSLNPYRSSMSGINSNYLHVGCFPTALDAHKAAQLAKAEVISHTIEHKYKLEPSYRQDVAQALRDRVDQLLSDAANNIETKLL